LVVESDKPLPQVLKPSTQDFGALVGPACTLAEIRIAGEDRIDYVSRIRLSGLTVGWRKHLYPETSLSDASSLCCCCVRSRERHQIVT